MKLFCFTITFFPVIMFGQLTGTGGNDASMCEGTSGNFVSFTGMNGTAPYTFEYSLNGGASQFITTISGNSISISGSSLPPGTNIYQLIQITDFVGNSAALTDFITVNVIELPIVDAGADQSVCPGTQVTITGSGASVYTWDNGVINGIPFMPTTTMVYTVTGTSLSGCTNTDQVTVHVECAAINETVMNNINISPNPAYSFVNIESEIVMNDISIFSVNGQFIKQLSPMSQKSIIDLSDLKAGVYFLKINSEIGSVSKRILKE
jgi:hypothetical protein